MRLFTLLCLLVLLPLTASGIVKYDEGRMEVNGVQLLQDSDNPLVYYYIPPYPRISRLKNGDFEFFCLKYVGTQGKEDSGGLLHALVQFSLPPEEFEELSQALMEKVPGAMLMGAVPLLESDEEGSPPGFRIVSSILREGEDNNFTTRVITSGKAPLLPGSKAAIAAELSADGATLLWESFAGSTSDVSVVVEGYYRALVKAYHAKITANLELVYDHFSSFQNEQSGFSREQTRQAIDSLAQGGVINIEIADLSESYGVNSKQYADLVNIITEKIVDLMFNVKTGWAKLPDTERGIEPDELKERYERGAFVSFFFGDGTQPYIPDDQLLLKQKHEIRNFHFSLNLSQATAIKVPVYSAGNLGGFYDVFSGNNQYFRVVDMNDPAFQIRDVHFQIDGSYTEAFGEVVDHASVRVRKRYSNEEHNAYSGTLTFNKSGLDQGKLIQSLSYKRLDDAESWLEYEYAVAWKLLGIDSTYMVPDSGWREANLSSISLQPPFERREIEIELNPELMDLRGYQSARIRFASILGGKPYKGKTLILRKSDTGESIKSNIYHDRGESVVYQVSWYGNNNKSEESLKVLDDDYLYLIPPELKE